MYAILDIETTGGQFNQEGITEIAIYKFDGHKVVDQFISLVNPERSIQPFVIKLTGINNAMLRSAPKFYEVARRIIEITEGCIVVAHNTSFDYRILRMEFNRLGYNFVRETLCTVELSKKLLPEQKSHSLGKLVRSLGIPVSDRHRASGDAQATVKLFKLLLSKDIDKQILKSLIKSEIKTGLSPKLLDIVESVPNATGVYYVHNEKGDLIYLGKSQNIKKKVNLHFTSQSKIAKKIQSEVYTVTYEETGSMLVAALKEYDELKHNEPVLNRRVPKIRFSKKFFSENKEDENLLIIDKGRNIEERSVVLIEGGTYKGYAFFDLNYQVNNLEVLKNILTPVKEDKQNLFIIESFIQKKNNLKIIRM